MSQELDVAAPATPASDNRTGDAATCDEATLDEAAAAGPAGTAGPAPARPREETVGSAPARPREEPDGPAPARPREEPDGGRPESPPRAPGRATRRWVALAIVVGYALHVAWRLWLTRNVITPAAHADEDAYLVAARALAGGPGGGTTENQAFRRLGYPLLLSPVYWFTSDAFAVYRGVQLVNAFVNALTLPLAYLFGRRVLALSRPWALAAGFAATAAPAIAFYAQFAITDAVLAPIGLAWLLMVHRWLTAASSRQRLLGALGAGAFAGFVYTVHVRGTVVVLVHGLLALTVWYLRRSSLRLAAASVLATTLSVGLDPALKLAIRGKITTWGHSPKEQTVNAVTTVSGVFRTLAGADGQLWYLSVATLGLGAIGVVATLLALCRPAVWRRGPAQPAPPGPPGPPAQPAPPGPPAQRATGDSPALPCWYWAPRCWPRYSSRSPAPRHSRRWTTGSTTSRTRATSTSCSRSGCSPASRRCCTPRPAGQAGWPAPPPYSRWAPVPWCTCGCNRCTGSGTCRSTRRRSPC